MRKLSEQNTLAFADLNDADLVMIVDVSANETKKMTWGELRKTMRPDIIVEAGATRSLTSADDGAVIRCTAVSGCTITVPSGLPLGWTCTIVRAVGAGNVQIDDDGVVSLQPPASATVPIAIAEAGATVGLVVVDDTVADDFIQVYGALA